MFRKRGAIAMIRTSGIPVVASLLICAFTAVPRPSAQQQQTMSSDNQYLVHGILRDAYNDVKKHYYDPTFHGVDWDARYRSYDARVATAHSLAEGYRVVASLLAELKDSHAYFSPPDRPMHFETGYRLSLVGNACFVAHVRPKTDAELKLKPGDEVLHLNGYNVDRADFHDIRYYFDVLAPQPETRIDVRSPAGEVRQVDVSASVRPVRRVLDLTQGSDLVELIHRGEQEEHLARSRVAEIDDVAIWRMPDFELDIDGIDKAIRTAKKHKALILDLRGNPGGSVDILEWTVGALFDHEIKIADRAGRNTMKPLVAKPHGQPFQGTLIVLVDQGSASAAELLSRVIQLEHRGTVIGDRTAGAVMEARAYGGHQGGDTRIFYGFSVTDANLIMSDGKSLESTGVIPDELLLPTGADLAAGRDPVLTHAASVVGVQLDPAAAGKLFPFEWMPLE
jgi:carboxyl-terminal processing protease